MVRDDIFFFHRPKEDAEEVAINEWSWSRNRLLRSRREDEDDFSRQI